MREKLLFNQRELYRHLADWGLLILLAGILVTVGLMGAVVGMRFAVRSAEVVVPLVTGKDRESAEAVLDGRDLGLEVIGDRYDDDVAKGTIISQNPRAGRRIKAKRAVQVMMSLGKRSHPVPDLIGSTLRVAQLASAQDNHEIGRVSEINWLGVEEGIVIQQYPAPGSTTVASPQINLLISRGKGRRHIMPDFKGKNLNEVQPFLQSQGFELANIEYRFYRNAIKGSVVKQFPGAGYLLTDGDTINLGVAR